MVYIQRNSNTIFLDNKNFYLLQVKLSGSKYMAEIKNSMSSAEMVKYSANRN